MTILAMFGPVDLVIILVAGLVLVGIPGAVILAILLGFRLRHRSSSVVDRKTGAGNSAAARKQDGGARGDVRPGTRKPNLVKLGIVCLIIAAVFVAATALVVVGGVGMGMNSYFDIIDEASGTPAGEPLDAKD